MQPDEKHDARHNVMYTSSEMIIEKLCEAYAQLLVFLKGKGDTPEPFEVYKHTLSLLTSVPPYSSDDVTRFCFSLASFETDENSSYAGLFLSALVNKHYESYTRTSSPEPYVLHLSHLEQACSCLGYSNRGATVRVEGNASWGCCENFITGHFLLRGTALEDICYNMRGGSVYVEGNAGTVGIKMDGGSVYVCGSAENVGQHLSGGEIIIPGDVKSVGRTDCFSFLGENMRGGTIIVHGSAKEVICGRNAKGGQIFIEGDFVPSNRLSLEGGKVYHRGKEVSGDTDERKRR